MSNDIDLHLLPGNNAGKAPMNSVAYRVEYKYPTEELAAANALQNKKIAQEKLDAKPEPRNWNYSMQIGEASQNIAPTMAYDDGRFTYLKFPNNRDFPAAFLVAADKTESLVNGHILRLGDAVVGIYNDSFDADGIPANQGTTVPGIKRVIKSGGDK